MVETAFEKLSKLHGSFASCGSTWDMRKLIGRDTLQCTVGVNGFCNDGMLISNSSSS
jgi:hypothetical protein